VSATTAEARARQEFERATTEHEVTVLRDDGLYRHLRCQAPGTWIYGFDVVTWPGYLFIGGDVEDFVFARISDMFEFFGDGTKYSKGINPGYWSEKLQGPRRGDLAQRYSPDRLRAQIREWCSERCKELDRAEAEDLKRAIADLLDREELADQTSALFLVRDFEHAGHQIYEPEEWDVREYTQSFLWCCWAIVWAIERYKAGRVAVPGDDRTLTLPVDDVQLLHHAAAMSVQLYDAVESEPGNRVPPDAPLYGKRDRLVELARRLDHEANCIRPREVRQ
jgi:hypothetical protein